MFKRNNILSLLLGLILVLSNTFVLAEGIMPQGQAELMDGGVYIPDRNASSWALDELVDSDRYGLYKVEKLYKNNLRENLSEELRASLLKEFKEKMENTKLEKNEKPEHLTEIKNSKSRGGFLRELYNVMVSYEDKENLGKDPIMYLNHAEILRGHGKELFLDRDISGQEGILFTKRAVDYLYGKNNLATEGLMWKVENKGNTVYLVGSIHYGEPDLYPIKKGLINNFQDSEKLFVEVDITNQEDLMRLMMEKMMEFEEEMKKASSFHDGTSLKSQIDPDLYSKIETIMNKNNIARDEYDNFKVQGIQDKLNEIILEDAFSQIGLQGQEEFDQDFEAEMEGLMDNELMKLLIEGPQMGMDLYFLDKAKTSNKEIGELESMESQMELLFGGGLFGISPGEKSKEEEIEGLRQALENFDQEGNILEIKSPEKDEEFDKNFEKMNKEMDQALEEQLNLIRGMFDAIKKGNAETLQKLFIESEGREILGGQLLGQRDKNMAKKISDLLLAEGEKTYFVVVGAAHFVVDGTILDNLKDMGYKVERLK